MDHCSSHRKPPCPNPPDRLFVVDLGRRTCHLPDPVLLAAAVLWIPKSRHAPFICRSTSGCCGRGPRCWDRVSDSSDKALYDSVSFFIFFIYFFFASSLQTKVPGGVCSTPDLRRGCQELCIKKAFSHSALLICSISTVSAHNRLRLGLNR